MTGTRCSATPEARKALGPLGAPSWLAACLGPAVTLGALQAWGRAHGVRVVCRLGSRPKPVSSRAPKASPSTIKPHQTNPR